MILYEKRGRRYYPASETDVYDGLPAGHWLVHVRPGSKSIHRELTPAFAELSAAASIARDAMMEAMHQRARMTGKPSGREATERERRAWAAYCDVMGGAPVPFWFEGVSLSDIVDAGIDAMLAKALEIRS